MLNTRYIGGFGNITKIDSEGNHFVNGKCVNAKEWEGIEIGDTFDPEGLIPFPISDEVTVVGHVNKFSYFDHSTRKVVFVSL